MQRLTLTAQQSLQYLFSQAGFPRLGTYPVAKALELGRVQMDQALVFFHRHHYRHIPLLTLDDEGLAPRSLDDLGEFLPCLTGRDGTYDTTLVRCEQIVQLFLRYRDSLEASSPPSGR
jgi:hypothetical protein